MCIGTGDSDPGFATGACDDESEDGDDSGGDDDDGDSRLHCPVASS